jgi:DNA-binding MarR family transcriptional regulator
MQEGSGVHDHPHTDKSESGARPDITLELAELFTHTARRLRRGSIVQLTPLGLTYAQARVLRLVAAEGRPLRMADLAAQLDVVPRSVTTMVDALETAGFVARHADPGDRRSVLVALSDQGRRLLDGLEAARRDSAEEVFGGLDPDQQNRLHELLEDLCARGACVSCCGPHGHDHGGHDHGGLGHGHHHSHDHDHGHGHGGAAGGGDR